MMVQTSQSLACRSTDTHSGAAWSVEEAQEAGKSINLRVNADLNGNLLSVGQWNGDSYGDDTETGCGRFNIDLHTSLPITYMMRKFVNQFPLDKHSYKACSINY